MSSGPGIDLKSITVWVDHENVPELVEENHVLRISNPEWMHGAPVYLQHGKCLTETEEVFPIPEWVNERMEGYSPETLATVGFAPPKPKRKYVKQSPDQPEAAGGNGPPGDG